MGPPRHPVRPLAMAPMGLAIGPGSMRTGNPFPQGRGRCAKGCPVGCPALGRHALPCGSGPALGLPCLFRPALLGRPVVPCGALWCPALPYGARRCLALPCGALWCPSVPCGALGGPALPCGALWCPVVPAGALGVTGGPLSTRTREGAAFWGAACIFFLPALTGFEGYLRTSMGWRPKKDVDRRGAFP